MVAEVQKYRGVVCVSCREPIPLPAEAAQRYAKFREQEPHDLAVPMFTLRCNACERDTLYSPRDIVDFEGVPKVRRVRKASASS
jgi:hypothetical protein